MKQHKQKFPVSLVVGVVTIVLSLGAIFSTISTLVTVYNTLVKSKNGAEQALNNLESFYQRRYALIDNLVAIIKETKGFEQYQIEIEKEIYLRVASAKAEATKLELQSPKETRTRIANETSLQTSLIKTLDKLLVFAPHYPVITDPTLKDRQATFQALQGLKTSLETLESDIQIARQNFNSAIRNYNQSIQFFPANFLARAWGFVPLKGFEVFDANAHDDAKITF